MYSLKEIYDNIIRKQEKIIRFKTYKAVLGQGPELFWKNYEIFLDRVSITYMELQPVLKVYLAKKHNCRCKFVAKGPNLSGCKNRYDMLQILNKFVDLWECKSCHKPDMYYKIDTGIEGICRGCNATRKIKL